MWDAAIMGHPWGDGCVHVLRTHPAERGQQGPPGRGLSDVGSVWQAELGEDALLCQRDEDVPLRGGGQGRQPAGWAPHSLGSRHPQKAQEQESHRGCHLVPGGDSLGVSAVFLQLSDKPKSNRDTSAGAGRAEHSSRMAALDSAEAESEEGLVLLTWPQILADPGQDKRPCDPAGASLGHGAAAAQLAPG